MRILVLAPYLSLSGVRGFDRNVTGLGMMVGNIITELVRQGEDVDVLTISGLSAGCEYNGAHILAQDWKGLVRSICPRLLANAIRDIGIYRPTPVRWARIMYYALAAGFAKRTIRTRRYDVIHIHGLNFATTRYLDACQEAQVPTVLTLHGLNTFSNTVMMDEAERRHELPRLYRAMESGVTVSAISSGIRRQIENEHQQHAGQQAIHVIPNGTRMASQTGDRAMRTALGIGDGERMLLCVGNLSVRKNQLQVVRAFARLDAKSQSRIRIVFVGRDASQGAIESEIAQRGVKHRIHVAGFVEPERVHAYYEAADGVVISSKSEGFGLSAIEGFANGVPCVLFSDLDAFDDIYHPDAVIPVTRRTDEALADGLWALACKEWDRKRIREYALKFTLTNSVRQYRELYAQVVTNMGRRV